MVRGDRLDVTSIKPKVYPLAELPAAMEAALNAGSLECAVVRR
jgi:hypothetical protein